MKTTKYNFPVSMAKIKNYKIKELKTFNCNKSTKFQVASIGKPLTALLVLKLVQEKRLDLNKDVNNYLKKWKVRNKKGKLVKVDLKQLLSHTAGISISGFLGYNSRSKLPTINQTLDGEKPCNTEKIFAKYKAGKYRYSGGGYVIIQRIVEDVTGKRFKDIMKSKIFKPLQMKDSDFKLRKSKSFRRYPQNAGMWSTPEDLSKFLIEIQLSCLGKSNKILSKNSVKKMLKPIAKAEGNSIGLGLFISRNKKNFYHTGHNYKFRSKLIGSLNKGKGLVIMANSDKTLKGASIK